MALGRLQAAMLVNLFRSEMRPFRELAVWSKSHALTVAVFRATQRVRRADFPGLVSQLRRAAASIPTNIAEGCGHVGQREFARFLQIAMASASELEYLLLLACELGMISSDAYQRLASQVTEVKRMLAGLIKKVSSDARSLAASKASGPRARPLKPDG